MFSLVTCRCVEFGSVAAVLSNVLVHVIIVPPVIVVFVRTSACEWMSREQCAKSQEGRHHEA